jgi:hypothetical protein
VFIHSLTSCRTDDRRDIQRPRHDGGVRRLAADVRGEAEHQRAIELRGIARRQIPRHQHVGRVNARQRHALLPHQVVDNAPADIVNVARALTQIRVVDIRQCPRIAIRDLRERRVRR